MDVVSITTLKVIVREVFGATDEAESEGKVESTEGLDAISESTLLTLSLLFLKSPQLRINRNEKVIMSKKGI